MPLTCQAREDGTHSIEVGGSDFDRGISVGFFDIIASHAREGDVLCRLSPVILDVMRRDGLFRSLQPRRFGGHEVGLGAFFDRQMDIAAADMSTGWLFGVMGMLAFHLALFPPEAQTDVWAADPDALLASSYMQTGKAIAVTGGYELGGRWRFASGADYADWFLLGARVDRDEDGEAVVFLIPREDVTVDRSWQTAGLRGTGSQDLSIERCFVPMHRAHSIRERFLGESPGLEVNDAPLYRIPLPQLLVRVISVPAMGALRGGLAALIDYSAVRQDLAGQRVAANSAVQLTIGDVAADIDEMVAVLHYGIGHLSQAAMEQRDLSLQARMILRLQASRIADRCCHLMHRLFVAAGASGLSSDAPFGRIIADIQASRQHAANQFEPFGQTLGANLLGMDSEDSLL
jgi:3-hydroxy-9,10-secoandrosta-1,3,5(10)-triene-9,17-dione monooxygenase